jgi:hypothetical protein
MVTAKKLLLFARQVIQTPEQWTQHVIARDAEETMIFPESDRAVCWCSMGALQKAKSALNAYSGPYEEACDLLCDVIGGSVTVFNDTHKHEEVLEMFDKAISNAH